MNFYNEHDPKAAAWLCELIAQGHIPPGDVDERSITEIKPHELNGYTQCHFFAGIGGWSLALQLAGWPATEPVWTGSCPCQPFSAAGRGEGKADERHLWPVFFRLIAACRPPVVFGEQVASALVVGKVGGGHREADGPVWLDGVFADLESAGYTTGASVLGAHSVGAPHIRQRLYWVADADGRNAGAERQQPGGQHGQQPEDGGAGLGLEYAASDGRQQRRAESSGRGAASGCGEGDWQRVSFATDCLGGEDGELGDECSICGLDYANECKCPGPTQDDEFEYEERGGILYARRLGDADGPGLSQHGGTVSIPPQQPAAKLRGDVGAWSDFDLLPCTDGKARRVESGTFPLAHGVPARVVRLRGYGNAIVPQVAALFIEAHREACAHA